MFGANASVRRLAVVAMCAAAIFCLGGCAATQVALEHKDLDVQNKMSATIFLDPVSPDERTIYIEIKNTSDKELDLGPEITGAIAAKGYQVVRDPKKAHYMLQANVLSVGKASPSAIQETLGAGYGGSVLLGAAIGGATTRSWGGAAAGGLVGGIAETVTGSLVKNVTFAIVTDVQLSERSEEEVDSTTDTRLGQGTSTTIKQKSRKTDNWKRYQTRIVSSANQVNLKFEEALPELRKGLTKSLSGLF
jgi:hypothetical protein